MPENCSDRQTDTPVNLIYMIECKIPITKKKWKKNENKIIIPTVANNWECKIPKIKKKKKKKKKLTKTENKIIPTLINNWECQNSIIKKTD